MQIINVVEIINGNLSRIESFPIIDSSSHKQQVQKAEALFLEKVKENSHKQEEIEDDELLDDSYWSDNSGYEVIISWSDVTESDTTSPQIETFKNGGRGYYTSDGREFYNNPGSNDFQEVSNGFLNTARNYQ